MSRMIWDQTVPHPFHITISKRRCAFEAIISLKAWGHRHLETDEMSLDNQQMTGD